MRSNPGLIFRSDITHQSLNQGIYCRIEWLAHILLYLRYNRKGEVSQQDDTPIKIPDEQVVAVKDGQIVKDGNW